MILRMRAGLLDTYLAANLFLEAVVSIGFVPGAVAHAHSASAERQEKAIGSKVDYAKAAEAFQNETARAAGLVEAWVKWADFDLERFRVLELELRRSERNGGGVEVAGAGLARRARDARRAVVAVGHGGSGAARD